MKEQIFYYRFKRLNAWLIFNIIFAVLMIYGALNCPQMWLYTETYIIIGALCVSIALWCYKYLYRHIMAVINDESITIDHCNSLRWKDIEKAEEREIRCCGKKRIIVLLAKENIDYQYNWLQLHNSDFTPFSIPLYDILSPNDKDEIIKIISRKTKLHRL